MVRLTCCLYVKYFRDDTDVTLWPCVLPDAGHIYTWQSHKLSADIIRSEMYGVSAECFFVHFYCSLYIGTLEIYARKISDVPLLMLLTEMPKR